MPTLVDADRKLFVALGRPDAADDVFIDAQGRRFLCPSLDERRCPSKSRAHTAAVTL